MHRRLWLGLFVALAWFVMAAAPAQADAPHWRGDAEPEAPQGGTGPTVGPPGTDPWREVRPLPPLQGLAPTQPPGATPPSQLVPPNPLDPLGALGTIINPGKWTVEGGMGIASGIARQVVGLEQLVVTLIMGTPGEGLPSDYPQGCAHEALARNLLYCTPFSYTTANPAVLAAMGGLRQLAYLVLSLLFSIRAYQIAMLEGRDWLKESKALLVGLIVSVLLISQSVAVIDILITISNYLSAFVTGVLPITLLGDPIEGMQLGELLAAMLLYALLLILLVKAVARMVRLALMVSLTPLMGMLFFLPQTRSRTTSWGTSLVDLLLQQFAWLFLLGLGSAFVAPWRATLPAGVPEPVAQSTLPGIIFGIVTLIIALNGERILGISAVAQGGWVGQLVKTKLLLSTMRLPKLAGRTAKTATEGMLKTGGRAAATALRPALNPFKNIVTGGASRAAQQTAATAAAKAGAQRRSRVGQVAALLGHLPGLKHTAVGQAIQTAGLSPAERGRDAELRDRGVQAAEQAVADVRRAQRWAAPPRRGPQRAARPTSPTTAQRAGVPLRRPLAHIQTPGATPDAPTVALDPATLSPRMRAALTGRRPRPTLPTPAMPSRGPLQAQRRPPPGMPQPAPTRPLAPPAPAAPPAPRIAYQQALAQVTAEHTAERTQLDQAIAAGESRLRQLQHRQGRLAGQITAPRPGSTPQGTAARIAAANRLAGEITTLQTTLRAQQQRRQAIAPRVQEAPLTRREAAARAGLKRAVDETGGTP